MVKRIIRVFPRRTNASPTDDLARFGAPAMWDEADEVRVSVAFDWDKPKAERLSEEWQYVTGNVTVGGPAYGDPGGDFEPGMYLRHGYTITSRGCPGKCEHCLVPIREGRLRTLPICDGWILQDNNILACPKPHIHAVFDMLERQPHRAQFTGGLESRLLKPWHVDRLARIKPKEMWFAYDEPADLEPLVSAGKMLDEAGLMTGHRCCCYVLIGMAGDTIEAADERCKAVARLGYFPQSMLLNGGVETTTGTCAEWKAFHRTWANKIIVGAKLKRAVVVFANEDDV